MSVIPTIFRPIQTICFAAILGASCLPSATAQVQFTHSAQEMRAQGDFCAKKKIGMAGRYRSSSPEAVRFNLLDTCESICYHIAMRLEEASPHTMSQQGIDACNASFAALPAELRAEMGEAPAPAIAPLVATLSEKADECAQMAGQYPRLAVSKKFPAFSKCQHACSMAAQEIDRAGANVGNFQTACETQYSGAMARIPAAN